MIDVVRYMDGTKLRKSGYGSTRNVILNILQFPSITSFIDDE